MSAAVNSVPSAATMHGLALNLWPRAGVERGAAAAWRRLMSVWVMPSHPREAIEHLRRRARLEARHLGGGGQTRRRLLLHARERAEHQPADVAAARAPLRFRQVIQFAHDFAFDLKRDEALTRTVSGHARNS